MYTPYLLILTMFSGAGEIVDPEPHASLESCESELVRMQAAVENEWAEHGILRVAGECRDHDPSTWSTVAERRPATGESLSASAD